MRTTEDRQCQTQPKGNNAQSRTKPSGAVIVFDECLRSQFGEMHEAITKHFRKYHLFGFTGTPIFADNAGTGGNPSLRTTEQDFGDKLHTCTTVDAIRDENALPFRIDCSKTIRERDEFSDEKVYGIYREGACKSQERVDRIVNCILEHFAKKTCRRCDLLCKELLTPSFRSNVQDEGPSRQVSQRGIVFGRVLWSAIGPVDMKTGRNAMVSAPSPGKLTRVLRCRSRLERLAGKRAAGALEEGGSARHLASQHVHVANLVAMLGDEVQGSARLDVGLVVGV